MELNVKELSASEKEIEISLKFDDVKTDIETEVKKQTKNIQIPGFRKGKVPKNILKKRFGNSLEYEASEKIANKQFWEIAKEKNLNPIGQPTMTDFDFKPGEDLHFKVKYEVLPQIELEDYTDQKIEVPDFKVKDSDVEKEIDHLVRSNKTLEDTEVVGDDNNYLLDALAYRLNSNGEPENEMGEKLEIDLTNESVNKDIIENSKGKKVGDSFTFSFDEERTVTNDKGEEKRVKENFSYKVDIKGIKKIIYPELNEEFIKKISKNKVSNKADLKKEIKKDIENYYEGKIEEILRGALITTLIKNNEFTPPSTLVNNILGELVKNEEEYLKKQGYPKVDSSELKERYKTTAENDVKWFLIKSELFKKENIFVTDDELKELAEKDTKKTGIPAEKLLNYYKKSGLNDKLLDQKLFEFLKEKNNIVMVDPEKFNKSKTKEE
ncbi:MAG: trigger factor [Bacteroidetes bacterium]|nr:trigger factor [Bacteroidota bacterium]MCH8032535.1 trigger factor [Bacteroidota bacterium]